MRAIDARVFLKLQLKPTGMLRGNTRLAVAGLALLAATLASAAAGDQQAASEYGATFWIPPLDKDGTPAEECTAAVVWMHGLGDTGKGWQSHLRSIHAAFPHICFVLPTAPTRPVALNGGRPVTAWFDVAEDDIAATLDGKDGDAAGVEASARFAANLVAQVARRIGEAPSRVIVAGFSQGAVIALHAGLRYPALAAADARQPLDKATPHGAVGGVLAVGGFLAAQSTLLASATRGGGRGFAGDVTRVLIVHGDADDVVPPGLGVHAATKLKKVGAKRLEHRSVAGMRHGLNDEGMRAVVTFIRETLPPDGERADL